MDYEEIETNNNEISEKASAPKETIKKLLNNYLVKKKFMLFAILTASVLNVVFIIATPFIIGMAITEIFNSITYARAYNVPFNINSDIIIAKLIILFILFILSSIFKYIEEKLIVELSQYISLSMRKDISEKLNKLPLKFYDTNKKGDILNRITNDIENISTSFQDSLSSFLNTTLSAIAAFIMMLVISRTLTIVALITFPIIIFIVTFISKKSYRHLVSNRVFSGELNAHIEEAYSGNIIIKAFSKEKETINTFEEINQNLFNSNIKAQFFIGVIPSLIRFIVSLGYVIISVVGGVHVMQGKITIGNIQAFISYYSFFGEPIADNSYMFGLLQSAIASSERVFEVLDAEEEEKEIVTTSIPYNTDGKVEFKNVKFGYSDDNILMENINIKLNSNEKVAIVGPTGAGKTTFVNLIMRFYEIQDGEILIDNINIKDISKKDLRNIFGMVLQDTWIFKGSILENISYSKPHATFEKVVKICKASRLHHFIKTLPDGYNTILDDEGSNISQGQKQLITIARVMLKNPNILILDEATSNIDTKTEIDIQRAMSSLMHNRTSFIIAHRLSTIVDASLILVMKNGTIIEMGNHKELLNKDGFYKSLYNSQFE